MDYVKFVEDSLWKIWSIMVCLGSPYQFKFFKGCLPQILLDSFLNTLTHITLVVPQKDRKCRIYRGLAAQFWWSRMRWVGRMISCIIVYMERLEILLGFTSQTRQITFVVIHNNYSKLNLVTSYDKCDRVTMGNRLVFVRKTR